MRTFRWHNRILVALIALLGVGLVGCKNQLTLEPADWKEGLRPSIPPSLEKDHETG